MNKYCHEDESIDLFVTCCVWMQRISAYYDLCVMQRISTDYDLCVWLFKGKKSITNCVLLAHCPD